jgi:predicted porin
MKKLNLLTLSILAGTSSLAMAQGAPSSNVTLYGILDAGITHVTGLPGGSQTMLSTGIMEGSRWGLRGSEDLGGGYRSIFTLEARVQADDGSNIYRPPSGGKLPDRLSTASSLGLPTALQPAVNAVAAQIGTSVGVNLNGAPFDRQAFVGMVTPVGAITAGRQYTPGYLASAAFDVMKTESSLALGQLVAIPASFDIRVNNALQYGIKKDGITATAMYAFGEVAGNNSAGRLWGAMAMYEGDMFSFGGGYNARNNELGQDSLSNAVAGANVKFPFGTFSATYATIKDDNPTGLSGIRSTLIAGGVSSAAATAVQNAFINGFMQDAVLYQIGYRLNTGPHTFTVAYNNMNDKTNFNADRNSYGGAYTYAFSKRTDMSFIVTRFNNKNSSQDAPGGNGYIGGVTASAGTDSTSIAFGMRHRF